MNNLIQSSKLLIADKWSDYELIDCGDGQKLERWGKYIFIRPDPQVIWPKVSPELWKNYDAIYQRWVSNGIYNLLMGGTCGFLRMEPSATPAIPSEVK